jgi:hypothetical protein
MAITADYQIEVPARSILIGAGTDYIVLSNPGPAGLLGTPPVRVDDVDLLQDGASGGRDLYSSRIITVPVAVKGTQVQANQRLRALSSAWRRSSDTVAMDVRVPGQPETVLRYFGRCRGAAEQGWNLRVGYHAMLLAFTALDPFAYGAEVVSATDSASPLTIAAAALGDPGTSTDRAVLTILAAGGRPTVTNEATGGVISFAQNVTGTYTLDLHDQITTAGSVNRDSQVGSSSDWFALAGGIDNVLTFTGATSIQVTHRPAYEVI